MSIIKTPKKLIEVALPLDEINQASAREKSIRHGHPSTLHLWWARRPLAAARAVIFAQMVNDPGYERSLGRGVNKAQAKVERERLFSIIRKLVQWETSNDPAVLAEARKEMWKSWRETCELNKSHPQAAELFNPEKLPGFHDPFAGGGALPLEAQRLGLESNASDLNPVAVLINKAMIEISPRFSGQSPVGPLLDDDKQTKIDNDWSGAKGIAEDVRRYGAWMRAQAFEKIGHLYPQVNLPSSSGGGKATVIAWLWARTVKSPNPAYSHVDVPLVSTFIVSSKAGREAWVDPIVEGDSYRFEVKYSKPPERAKGGTTAGKRGGFVCLVSGSPMDYKYIRSEGAAGRMGQKLLAVVAEGPKGRIYMSPTSEIEQLALNAKPEWRPETKLHGKCRVNVSNYGFDTYGDLFTDRQIVALTTFSDLVQLAQAKVKADAIKAGMNDDGLRLSEGGSGATAYSEAVGIYLGFGSSRAADAWSGVVTWRNQVDATRNTFARQAIPMTWDFAEVNPFSDSCGNWTGNSTDWVVKSLLHLPQMALVGKAQQADAATQSVSAGKVVSTDPPYYDNIAYADLSDFFYVWLRRALRGTYPDLFSTMAVPKTEELVATPYRHASKEDAEAFFLNGMTEAMHRLSQQAHTTPSSPSSSR